MYLQTGEGKYKRLVWMLDDCSEIRSIRFTMSF